MIDNVISANSLLYLELDCILPVVPPCSCCKKIRTKALAYLDSYSVRLIPELQRI